jgi:hypothetical protein
MKQGQIDEVYEKCIQDMLDIGYKIIYIPVNLKKYTKDSRHICFVSQQNFKKYKDDNKFVEFHLCKICKDFHSLEECSKVMCHICKQVGHLTRRCPNAKCSICNENHLTSRCKKIKCLKCKHQGHIASRCRNSVR